MALVSLPVAGLCEVLYVATPTLRCTRTKAMESDLDKIRFMEFISFFSDSAAAYNSPYSDCAPKAGKQGTRFAPSLRELKPRK